MIAAALFILEKKRVCCTYPRVNASLDSLHSGVLCALSRPPFILLREASVSRGIEERRRRRRRARCRVIRMQTAIVIAHRNTQPVFRRGLAALPPPPTLNEERKRANARGVNFKWIPIPEPLPLLVNSPRVSPSLRLEPVRLDEKRRVRRRRGREVGRSKLKRSSPHSWPGTL